MICHNCGAPVRADAGFCWACGTVLAPNGPFGPAGPAGPPSTWPDHDQGAPAPPVTGTRRRRRRLTLGLAVLTVVAVAAATAVVVLPRLRDEGDDAAAGEIPEGQIVSMTGSEQLPWVSGQVEEPARAWSVETELISRPLFGEQNVFDVETVDGQAVLVARALSDGTEVWRTDFAPDGSVHLIDDHLVVLGRDRRGLAGYDQASGELAWASVLKMYAFSVRAMGDLLLLASDEQVVALRGDTGDQAWSAESTSFLSAVTSDRVHTVWGAQVRALALADGAEIWSTDLSGATSSVLASGDRLLAQVEDEVVGLSADDGEPLWTTPVDTGDDEDMKVVGDSTVVATGNDEVVAIDSVSGSVLSDDEFHLDGEIWVESIGFRLTTGRVMLLSTEPNGWAQVLDGSTGEPIGRIDDWADLSATMIYASTDDRVTAYRLDDMEEQWSVDIDGASVVTPGNDVIIVTTEAGFEVWT